MEDLSGLVEVLIALVIFLGGGLAIVLVRDWVRNIRHNRFAEAQLRGPLTHHLANVLAAVEKRRDYKSDLRHLCHAICVYIALGGTLSDVVNRAAFASNKKNLQTTPKFELYTDNWPVIQMALGDMLYEFDLHHPDSLDI